MYVTVHVETDALAEDPDSTDLRIVKKKKKTILGDCLKRKSVKMQVQSQCSVFVCVLDCAMNENEEAENRIL